MDSFTLANGWIARDARTAVQADLHIENGQVQSLWRSHSSTVVDMSGYLILPGLINAHDHLEFNLFPRLGAGPYSNYEEWANDIYHPDQSPLREHLGVPKAVRLWWGGLKNLLSGVTTVCHHNAYDAAVFGPDFPVRVVKRYGWAHSLSFGENVKEAFQSTDPEAPFIIHLGEGVDERSRNEIFVLDQMGALDSRTVIVHGVALRAAGQSLWRKRGAGLVWCPTSNRFMLGITMDAAWIASERRVALGSDSALTAVGDLLDEIRAAGEQEGAAPETLYWMVTEAAAGVLRLCEGEGTIQPGGVADLVAIPWKAASPARSLMRLDRSEVALVIVRGRPNAMSGEMAERWPQASRLDMEWIDVGGVRRLVRAPVRRLLCEARSCLPDGVQLAGRRASQ